MTEQQRRDLVLRHGILRGQLIALQGRWQQRVGEGVSAWAKRGSYHRGYLVAYQTAINYLTGVLDGDQSSD